MDFHTLRSDAAATILDTLGEWSIYTPVGNLDSRPLRVIVHRDRRSQDPQNRNRPSQTIGSERFSTVTINRVDLDGGAAGDTVRLDRSGETLRLDTVVLRDEVKTVWTVKTIRTPTP